MNSKIKGIIICGVVVACLGVTLAVLELTGKPDDSSSDPSALASELIEDENTIPLTAYVAEDISKITFENEHGTLNITRNTSMANKDAEWSMDELGDIKPNSTAVKACVNICAGLKGRQLVEENASDLAKYGLADPAARIAVSADGQSGVTFLIGDEIPTGNYRYAALEGSSDVYTVLITNVNYFLQDATYFCSLSIVDTPSDDDWPEIERLTVKRKDLDYDMVFVTVDEEDAPIGMVSTQAMIKPVYAGLDITNSSAVTHGIWGLEATEAVVLKPTDEDLAEYGLDDPQCTVILDTDSQDYTLKVGNTIYATNENGEETSEVTGYYCYINAPGADCIYIVAAAECAWATVLPGDIIAGQMAGNFIMDLTAISVSGAGVDSKVDINAVEEDEENGVEEVFEVSIDGKAVDGDLFKDWYVYWLECPTDETYFEPLTENETLYMTVTLTRKDGTEQVVKFYQTSGRRLVVEIDGNVGYKIPLNYADTLADNLKRVANGENVIETY